MRKNFNLLKYVGKKWKCFISITFSLLFAGCDQWTSTYIENSMKEPIFLEFIRDTSAVNLVVTRIEYRKKINMDPLVRSEHCICVYLRETEGLTDVPRAVICDSRKEVKKEDWRKAPSMIWAADFEQLNNTCSKIDTLNNGKLRILFVIPAGQTVKIGDVLGPHASSVFKDLHILWRNRENTVSRMDLTGYDAITRLAERKGNHQIITIDAE